MFLKKTTPPFTLSVGVLKGYNVFQELDFVRTFRMSQWDHLPSGSKRMSDLTEHERTGSHRLSFQKQSHTSQSPKASTIFYSSQEGRTPKAVGQSPFLTAAREVSFDVGGRMDASLYASSSTMKLTTPSSRSAVELALPPITPASPRSAGYVRYSGNLPQKLGADYITIQSLHGENNDLSSAYAQAQIYIADLNTEVQASQAEIGKLVKERQRLMGRIEFLEAQLEELERSIQQSQNHTATKDAQYSRIMDLSTRLQSQSAEDRKAERHEWSCEKKNMQNVIDALNDEVDSLREVYPSYAKDTRFTNLRPSLNFDRPNELAVDPSSHKDPMETEALKHAYTRMRDALAGVRGDKAQLAEYIEKLGSVEKNIHRRLDEVESAKGLLDNIDGEGDKRKEWGLAAKERALTEEGNHGSVTRVDC